MFQINEWKWEQSTDAVTITLDVTRAMRRCISDVTNKLEFNQDMVRTKMQANVVEVTCYDQKNTWELVFALVDLPGIDPEKSSFTLRHSSSTEKATGVYQSLVLNLVKSPKGKVWDGCGRQKAIASPKLPVVTVKSYSWSDGEQYVTVYLKIPGVHLIDDSFIEVRYRELSFDVSCQVDSKRYCFAVTELPMEIEVDRCSHRVKENELRIKLRKWARCSWFKLQVHRLLLNSVILTATIRGCTMPRLTYLF